MPYWTVVALMTFLLPGLPLLAQGSSLSPGSRIRGRLPCGPGVAMPPCGTVVGRLIAPVGDSLVLQDERGVTRRIDLTAGVGLERSVGSRRHTLLGLGVGGLVGLGTGAALASGCTRGGRGEDDGFCNLHYLVSVPVGAGLGALVGALIRTERWESVALPQFTLQVRPLARRTTVAVTLRF